MFKSFKQKFSVMLVMAVLLALGLSSAALAADTVITMRLGSPSMTVNGTVLPIDSEGTTAITVNGRTMLPLRAIAEALGLTVEWDGATQTVTLRSADGEANPQPEQTPTDKNSDENNDENNDEQKILVAYFSATGNTENVAKHIAAALGAEVYEITPETPYTSADLNYGDNGSRTSQEQNDPAARPAISGGVEDMAQYDIVFVGYPIWWGQAPKIISTFLESYDFSGKTIVPFCTSGSSPIGSSATNLHSLAERANWLSGQRFSGSASQTAVANWVNGLGLTANR